MRLQRKQTWSYGLAALSGIFPGRSLRRREHEKVNARTGLGSGLSPCTPQTKALLRGFYDVLQVLSESHKLLSSLTSSLFKYSSLTSLFCLPIFHPLFLHVLSLLFAPLLSSHRVHFNLILISFSLSLSLFFCLSISLPLSLCLCLSGSQAWLHLTITSGSFKNSQGPTCI